MVDADQARLEVDRLAGENPEEIRQRDVDARLLRVIPIHFQHQPRVPLPGVVVRDVEIRHLSRPLQVGQLHLFALGDVERVVLDVAVRRGVGDSMDVLHLRFRRAGSQDEEG